MSMPLPDIDSQDWEEYQRQQLQQQLDQKMNSFGLQQMIDQKMSDLHSLTGGAPPEPQYQPDQGPLPQPAPEPAPPLPTPEPQYQPDQTPPPQPDQSLPSPGPSASGGWATDTAPPPAPEPEPQPSPLPPEQPAAAPSPPPPSPVSAPVQAPSQPSSDWMSSALNAVEAAGGSAQTFMQNYQSGADPYAAALNAAGRSGADVRQFSSSISAPPPPVTQAPDQTYQTPASLSGASGPSGTSSVTGVPDWLTDLIVKNAPPELQGDANFIRTVAAGAKAESGWDPNAVQKGGGGRGLFQFDLGGMGKPYASNEQQLLGDSGAQLQASQIIPLYAKAYSSAPSNLSGAEKASWVAAQAERPYDYTNPASSARRNYASAFNDIGGSGGDQNVLQRAGGAVSGAASAVGGAGRAAIDKISQFGDSQLSSDEAYAACGPAAAVRFAQMYGRNPSLREATDLAKSVGWTASSGMAGLGSEKALMDKLGIATRVVGTDVDAMAKEAQTGNPITISTPGHYFFADNYDPSTGAFHVGASGTDLKGGSEWMTMDQMQARMGKVQGALFADNPQVPAVSTSDQGSNPLDYLGRAKDAVLSRFTGSQDQSQSQTYKGVMQPADQPSVDTYGRINSDVLGKSSVPELDNAIQSAVSGAGDVAGSLVSKAGDLLGSAGSTVGDLSSRVGTGAQAGLDVLNQQNQDAMLGPGQALTDYVDAVRSGDTGAIAKSSLGLFGQMVNNSPAGGPSADVSPSLSAGLTAAGVDPNVSRVLGQAGNVALPLGIERGIPAAADAIERGAPRALDAALTGLDRLSPPDIANASTQFPAGDLSGLAAGDLGVRTVTPQEARQLVGPAFDPSGRTTATPGDGGREPLDMSQIPMGAASQSLMQERAGVAITPEATARIADLNSQVAQLQSAMPRITTDDARTAVNSEIDRINQQITDLGGQAVGRPPSPTGTPLTDMNGSRIPTDANGWPRGTGAAPARPDVPTPSGTAPPPVDLSTPTAGRSRLDMSQIPLSPESQRTIDRGPSGLPAGARPITLSPEAEAARLRLQDYPEEVRDVVRENAQGIDWARLQRRGVISDEASRQMAEDYANNTTLSQTINNGQAGKAYNAEQIRALKNAVGAQAVVVRDAAAKVGAGANGDAELQRFAVEANRLQQLTRITEGARAEAGRGLRAWQDASNLVNLQPSDAVAQLGKLVGGDRSKLLATIGEYQKLIDTGAGPTQLAEFWAKAKAPPAQWQDWFKLVRYNSMLSGPRTFEVNGISNMLEVPWRLARDSTASVLRGRPGEIGVELNGAAAGFAKANKAFLDTLTSGITPERALRGELPVSLAYRVQNPVGKAAARALEVPTRLLGAADEWSRAIDYGMSLGRVAARKASDEGLRGDAWSQRVAQILAAPETAPDLMRAANSMADRMTYKGSMPEGGLGAGLQAFNNRAGVIGNIVMPFLRTTYHITSRGIDRSPLGLIGTGVDVARGAYGRDLGASLSGLGETPKGMAPLGERLGDNLIGSSLFAGLYWEAQQKNISGAGPDNAQDRNLLRTEGWQPYSVKIGDKWISYANWGPAAVPLSLAAAAAETQRFGKPNAQTLDYVVDGVRRTTQIAQEQTYLQAIGTVWKGLQDPAQYGSQFVNDFVTSLIPYGSAINTVASAFDPTARRVDRFNVLDAIQSRLPPGTPVIGGRTDVPASQDVLGRPAPNLTGGLGAANPLRVSQTQDEPLLKEMDSVGYAPPAAPKTITRGGVTYELDPDEQRQIYEAAGQRIAQVAGQDITSPSYQKQTNEGRARRLQAIVTNARTIAENNWIKSLSAEDRSQRQAQSKIRKAAVPVSGAEAA